jgi:hypothetical protein
VPELLAIQEEKPAGSFSCMGKLLYFFPECPFQLCILYHIYGVFKQKKASGTDSGCLPSQRDDLLTGLPPRVTRSLQRRFQEAKDQS